MTLYVDVEVSRIQEYLDRASKLWERRFASHAVDRATDPELITTVLPGFESHDEAGSAAGHIHLTTTPGTGPDQYVALLDFVRRELPMAQLVCWWQEAESYQAAAEAARAALTTPGRISGSGGRLTWLPMTAELSILQRCEACHGGIASGVARDPEKTRSICADCVTRQKGRLSPWRDKKGSGQHGKLAEPPLWEEEIMNLMPERTLDLADEFNQLHPNWTKDDGGPDADTPTGRGRHHATIHFDGNGIGDAFRHLAAASPGALMNARTTLSRSLARAIKMALDQATVDAHQVKDRRLLVQPHILGGDDILVTVWAPRAWAFVRDFIKVFNNEVGETVRSLQMDPELQLTSDAPTISAGVVIAADSFPFPQSRFLAEELLRQAKRFGAIGESSIGWIDVTADGWDVITEGGADNPPHPVLSLTALADLAGDLTNLASHTKSSRAALERAASEDRLHSEAKRNGVEELIKPFSANSDLDPATALRLVRWWPASDLTLETAR